MKSTKTLGHEIELLVKILMQSDNKVGAPKRLLTAFNLLKSEIGMFARLGNTSRSPMIHGLLDKLSARATELLRPDTSSIVVEVAAEVAKLKAYAAAAGSAA